MAKDKDRALNPAAQQRKADKQKALKKGKAEAQARRTEKLGRRNPERLQRQIDDLKAIEGSGQSLKPREKQVLEELERDVKAIRKAREALGEKAPKFGGGYRRDDGDQEGRAGGVLGKRRREDTRFTREPSSSETDEDVRRIPMPKDTPPPIPRQRPRNPNANMEPLGEGRGNRDHIPHDLPAKPIMPEVKTVYEAAPAVRDLRKEAVGFIPSVVRRKQDTVKGQGKLVEPEEMDRLEKEGYLGRRESPNVQAGKGDDVGMGTAATVPINAAPEFGDRNNQLADQEEQFDKEIRGVTVEDVEDEDL